ncbi:sigma-54 interaction domain-containing protein [Bacillus salipaludis]|uniref:sigma-54 interaction domain-containing protein n=1 Tax=Bacillus salipaludis TaxID=2547811 RepID=UPI002E23D9AE|nr:sigma 54-interacting transcriptional regulator [Bacillus salipaludis]
MNEMEFYKKAYEELESILDISFDGITIADGEGIFIRVSKSCEELFGVKPSKMIGKSASYLEEIGIFDISVTSEVLKSKKRVTIRQKTAADRIILVTGIPIFDKEKKKIEKIINISKDITETKKLSSDVSRLQMELDWYKQELQKRTRLNENNINFKSPAMQKSVVLAHHVADLPVTVLLLGETGVGKNFMAKLIHNHSKNKDKPFVSINCGAIPENLLESELFGYEKGAFSGASKEGKKGLFEFSKNGTIFLDEIGDMPLSLQVKLLHVLDDKKVRRIGGSASYDVKARVIAATNKNLKELVEQGKFREDLYYRLNVVPIKIPALRERKEDLLLLIQLFLDQFNSKYGITKWLSEEALKLLYKYAYPGNIRELENMMERLVINTIGNTIDKQDVAEVLEPTINDLHEEIIPLKEAVEQLEKKLLRSAFKKYQTTRKVAEVLQVDQSTIVKKAKRLNIT